MLIFADSRIPVEAQNSLNKFGELVLFKTEGITYESISGHPDIFLSQVAGKWVVAPNIPDKYLNILNKHKIEFIMGESPVGETFPATARYNILSTDQLLIHNFRHTDSAIINLAENLDLIHVHQGYTRCNLISLGSNKFITSDKGIHKVLLNHSIDSEFFDPESILLSGQNHGFLGGTTGIFENKVFLIGHPNFFEQGEKLKEFINKAGFEIISLYNGPLIDGGGILFIE